LQHGTVTPSLLHWSFSLSVERQIRTSERQFVVAV
jgi:hypothetical protein